MIDSTSNRSDEPPTDGDVDAVLHQLVDEAERLRHLSIEDADRARALDRANQFSDLVERQLAVSKASTLAKLSSRVTGAAGAAAAASMLLPDGISIAVASTLVGLVAFAVTAIESRSDSSESVG